jgi:nucleoside-diphosphate-sugar epimerase
VNVEAGQASGSVADMRIVIAGGHGKIALQLGRLLTNRGDSAVGLIRDPSQQDDLRAAGMEPVVLDLEKADAAGVAAVLADADAAVFAAGAGPGSGIARKDTVDRAGAVLLADGCERAGVGRYLLISSMGVETVRDGAVPEGVDDVFLAYLRAKLAAEEDIRARALAATVLRPGGLTDHPATGRVQLAGHVERGRVTRADVAAVSLALLDEPLSAGLVLELVGGDSLIHEAVAAL